MNSLKDANCQNSVKKKRDNLNSKYEKRKHEFIGKTIFVKKSQGMDGFIGEV